MLKFLLQVGCGMNKDRENKNLGGENMEDDTMENVLTHHQRWELQEEIDFLLSGRGKYLLARALVLLEKELDSIHIDWLREPSDLEDVRFLLNGDFLSPSVGAVNVAESFRRKNLDRWLKH